VASAGSRYFFSAIDALHPAFAAGFFFPFAGSSTRLPPTPFFFPVRDLTTTSALLSMRLEALFAMRPP